VPYCENCHSSVTGQRVLLGFGTGGEGEREGEGEGGGASSKTLNDFVGFSWDVCTSL
jgi:hypothetical protein